MEPQLDLFIIWVAVVAYLIVCSAFALLLLRVANSLQRYFQYIKQYDRNYPAKKKPR